MKFEVIHAQWAVEDRANADAEPVSVVFPGGVHDDVKLTKKSAPVFAAAEAAGSIVIHDVTDAERQLLDGHVQSQEDGEAALAEAMGDWIEPVYKDTKNVHGQILHRELVEPGRWSGPWHDANLAQFDLDVANGVRTDTLSLVTPAVDAEVVAWGDAE